MPHSPDHLADGARESRNEPRLRDITSWRDKLRYLHAKVNEDAPKFYKETMDPLIEKYGK